MEESDIAPITLYIVNYLRWEPFVVVSQTIVNLIKCTPFMMHLEMSSLYNQCPSMASC